MLPRRSGTRSCSVTFLWAMERRCLVPAAGRGGNRAPWEHTLKDRAVTGCCCTSVARAPQRGLENSRTAVLSGLTHDGGRAPTSRTSGRARTRCQGLISGWRQRHMPVPAGHVHICTGIAFMLRCAWDPPSHCQSSHGATV
jgi:hypothetical protein